MSNQGGHMFKVGDRVMVPATVIRADPDGPDVKVEFASQFGGGCILSVSSALLTSLKPCIANTTTPSIAEIAVRITAGLVANPNIACVFSSMVDVNLNVPIAACDAAESIHAELVKRGHSS